MSEEEVSQIKFFTEHIEHCCTGQVFSAPIRTPNPTEEEMAQWRQDYKMLCGLDMDGLRIKYGIKLKWDEYANLEEIIIDPKNRLQDNQYIDSLDWKARMKANEFADEREHAAWAGNYDWGKSFSFTGNENWGGTKYPDD